MSATMSCSVSGSTVQAAYTRPTSTSRHAMDVNGGFTSVVWAYGVDAPLDMHVAAEVIVVMSCITALPL